MVRVLLASKGDWLAFGSPHPSVASKNPFYHASNVNYYFVLEHVTNANDNTMHEDNLENQNSDDSENIQKCSDCNTESTDSSTGSSTFSSTESSTKAPPSKYIIVSKV
jgi:hypothetical protein